MDVSKINIDGNEYNVKDATARAGLAQIAAQNTYSTVEVDTGMKWIDGKDIYRRVFQLTVSAPSGETVVILPLSSVPAHDTVVNLYGYQQPVSGGWVPINALTERTTYNASGSQPGITFTSQNNRTNEPLVLVLEYTKI